MNLTRITLFLLFFVAYKISAQDTYRNWSVKTDSKENIALIIANNHYENSGRLEHPIPTAKQLKTKLSQLNFDVLEGHDLKRDEMREIIKDFSEKLKNYQFGMVFYMGHGFQIDGVNYLIPIDANPESKLDVNPESIPLEYLLYHMPYENIPKVIVLDACRNNPFDGKWSVESRSGLKEGFSELVAPINAEIHYTTQKNSVVRDDNPYMRILMEEMQDGKCLDEISRSVSKRILNLSKKSIPAKYGLLLDEVCFDGDTSPPMPVPNPTPINRLNPGADLFIINGTYINSDDGPETKIYVNEKAGKVTVMETLDRLAGINEYIYDKKDRVYFQVNSSGEKTGRYLYSPKNEVIKTVSSSGEKLIWTLSK